MKRLALAFLLAAVVPHVGTTADPKAPPAAPVAQAVPPPNPAIDMDGYLKSVQAAAKHRETRRVSEDDFIRMSAEPGTVVLDARSKELFDILHIKGAVNLSFPDIAVLTLQKTLPDKTTRILIYCNNNFKNAPVPFPTKAKVASLNIPTYITLYNYGYRNVYELAPQLDPKESKLTFESTPKKPAR